MSFIIEEEDIDGLEQKALLSELPSKALYGIEPAHGYSFEGDARSKDRSVTTGPLRTSLYQIIIDPRTKGLRLAIVAAVLLQIAATVVVAMGCSTTRMGSSLSSLFSPINWINFGAVTTVSCIALAATFYQHSRLPLVSSYLLYVVVCFEFAVFVGLSLYVLFISHGHGKWISANQKENYGFTRQQINQFNNYLIVAIALSALLSLVCYYASRALKLLALSSTAERKQSTSASGSNRGDQFVEEAY